MPLKLNCIMCQPIWCQDLNFPNEFNKNYEWIKTLNSLIFKIRKKFTLIDLQTKLLNSFHHEISLLGYYLVKEIEMKKRKITFIYLI